LENSRNPADESRIRKTVLHREAIQQLAIYAARCMKIIHTQHPKEAFLSETIYFLADRDEKLCPKSINQSMNNNKIFVSRLFLAPFQQ